MVLPIGFALLLAVSAAYKEEHACDWVVQTSFNDFSEWGGFTLDYNLGKGLPGEYFVFEITLEKGKRNSLKINPSWNADVVEISDPEPVPGYPDHVMYYVVFKTVSFWEVNAFGFKAETCTKYVSHKLVECAGEGGYEDPHKCKPYGDDDDEEPEIIVSTVAPYPEVPARG